MALHIIPNQSLLPYNTFGIDVKASQFVEIHRLKDLQDLIPILRETPFLILGGGSNVLFTKDFEGIVVLNSIRGKDIISQENERMVVRACSGENWHEFVLWTLEQHAFGLENLSLIPGTVGAAPMQNIGAYGEEIKNWCTEVEAIDLQTGMSRIFKNEECQFGYRESIFKRAFKNQYFVYRVTFCLHTEASHSLNCNYGAISEILKSKNIDNPTPKDISNAVIEIRQSKLPNPKELGNAGSFFKNPIVSVDFFESLFEKFPEIPHYKELLGVKIPAGWLIETCGFKGKIVGNTGSHKNQALVIVNYGQATGSEIYDYSQSIIDEVKRKYGVELEREVNII